MCLAVDADEHLIKMPAPQRIGSMTNAAFPDLGGKQRTKAVPPVPHGLMAKVDAPFEQKIFDLSQPQGVADIQHHHAADYLRRIVEITKGILHRRGLRNLTSQLKPIYSDNAVSMGSGQPLADPFLAFIARVLWGKEEPQIKVATLGVHWALNHTIEYAPGGVGHPIRIATLRRIKGKWNAELLGDEDLQGTLQLVKELEKRIGDHDLLFEVEEAYALPNPPSQPDSK